MPPLQRFCVIETRSPRRLREASPLFRRTEAFDVIGDPDRFRISVHSVLLDGIRISAVRTTGHRIRPVEDMHMTILLPWQGELVTEEGSRRWTVRPGELALVGPGARTTTIPSPYLGIVAQVPIRRLAQRVPASDNRRRTGPGIPVALGPLRRYLRHLVAELDCADSLLEHGRSARSAAEHLIDLLLDALPPDAVSLAGDNPPAGARQVERAEAVIRDRFHEHLSVHDVATAVSVSPRALQRAFRRHRDTTPQAVIAACRLEQARKRLATAHAGESVASIALDCGVTHLGRFATAYHARFGELPSATLGRMR